MLDKLQKFDLVFCHFLFLAFYVLLSLLSCSSFIACILILIPSFSPEEISHFFLESRQLSRKDLKDYSKQNVKLQE